MGDRMRSLIQREVDNEVIGFDPKGIDIFELWDQLEKAGATKNELDFLNHIVQKYDIQLFSLKDAIFGNRNIRQPKKLWKLMTEAGIITWEDLAYKIESVDDIRKKIPGINNPQFISIAVLYTRLRSANGLSVDPYWKNLYQNSVDFYRPKETSEEQPMLPGMDG